MTDRELIGQYVESASQQAFGDLVRRHAGWVYACARRKVRDAHSAEDVTQAVFILLSQNAKKLQGYQRLTAWLFKATHYCSANVLKQQARRHRHEREAAMRQQLATAGGPANWEEIWPVLDEAVRKLRSADREAVLLRFYQGMSLSELAGAIGTGEDAAKKRVQRAVERLRGLLAKKGVTARVGALGMVMTEKVTEAAPAGLVDTLVATSAAGGGGAGSAGVIAKGALKMMVWANMKVAAAILFGAGAVSGVGTSYVMIARDVPGPRAVAYVQPSADKPTTTPAMTQEQVVAEIEKCGGKVQWGVLVPGQLWPTVSVAFDGKKDGGVTNAGLGYLKQLKQVQQLMLDFTKVTDAGLENLKGLTTLQELDLNSTGVTDAGLERLRGLMQLQVLGLDNTKVGDTGLGHLRGLNKLKELDLNGTKVTDAGLDDLKGLNQLQALALIHTNVTDLGLENLKGLNQLQRLGLGYTRVSDGGLEHLKGLNQLRSLELTGTQVTDTGLESLRGLKQLRRLHMAHTDVTDQGVKRLQEALPECDIRR